MKFSKNFSAFFKKTEHCSYFINFILILFKYELILYLIINKIKIKVKIKMAIIFDKEGNLIRDSVKYKVKHDDLTNDLINEYTEKYYCSKCDIFHKRMFRGKPSERFKKHQKFIIKVSDSYVYNKKLSKSFNRYDINKHKKSRGSNKQ